MHIFQKEFVVSKITLALFLPKGKGTPIHRDRPTHGIVFNVGCTSIYRFESGEILTCHPGECIYLPKGSNYIAERHLYSDSEECGVYAINFLGCSEMDESAFSPCIIRIRGKVELTTLFLRASNAWKKKTAGFYEECFISLYRIVKLIRVESSEYAPQNQALSVLLPALNYINEFYTSNKVTVPHLATLCGVSEVYLRKLFYRTFSVSPVIYIRNMRIEYAKELLSSGEYSVTDAAMLSGFNDVPYFSREFKKATGSSPTEYTLEHE